ncbi:MAG: hypothetical protein JOZ69_17745, partial [Myxococcales bacterium]|nr:hypothetical protein [Myxococcales bacterium]
VGAGADAPLAQAIQTAPELVTSGGGLPPKLAPATTPVGVETTRPTALSVPPARKQGGAGSAIVWLALAGGMGVGGLGAVLALRLTAHPAQTAHLETSDSPAAQRPAGAAQAQPATLDDPAPPAPPTRGAPTAPPSGPRQSSPPTVPTVTVAALSAAPASPRPANAGSPAGAAAPRFLPVAGPAPAGPGNGNGNANGQGIPPAVAALLENSKEPAPAAGPAASPPEAPAPAPAAGTSAAAGGGGDPGQANLEALMRRAVAGSGAHAAPVPAAAAPPAADAPRPAGNLPQKPALGAVQGAVGAILPATRYCLGPDDPVSRATITFKSDGTVQGVTVTGDAAGQPAEDCIKARLMTTRVPPFSNPTFTWTVPVRPAN